MKKIIISFLSILPLTVRLHIIYLFKQKSLLNLFNPVKYSEKIQKRKLNIIHDYSDLSDKYKVREYVSCKIGDDFLNELFGCYDSIHDIDFDLLPYSFVIKTNFGSGCNHIEIVKDKSKIDIDYLISKFDNAMKDSYIGSLFGETQYDYIDKKIIVEKFIANCDGNEIDDFKFHIFNSKDGFLQIDFDRFSNHKRNLYDLKWRKLDYNLLYDGGEYNLPSDDILERLKNVSLKLSEGFDYVRVDLYFVNNQILFGELTFTPGSGLEPFSDKKADYKYGDMWKQ